MHCVNVTVFYPQGAKSSIKPGNLGSCYSPSPLKPSPWCTIVSAFDISDPHNYSIQLHSSMPPPSSPIQAYHSTLPHRIVSLAFHRQCLTLSAHIPFNFIRSSSLNLVRLRQRFFSSATPAPFTPCGSVPVPPSSLSSLRESLQATWTVVCTR